MLVSLLAMLPGHDAAYVAAGLSILVTVCSAIDAAFPQPSAGSVWVLPRKIVSFVAINFAYAKNAVPAGLPPAVQTIMQDVTVVAAAAPAVIAAMQSSPVATSAVAAAASTVAAAPTAAVVPPAPAPAADQAAP